MLDSVSPYALLRASIPKPPPTVVTAYELYSTAQHSGAQVVPPPAAPSNPPEDAPPAPDARRPSPYPPARRTHYIADIKTRHSAAVRTASMQSKPLT